jgi:hypothetical protein
MTLHGSSKLGRIANIALDNCEPWMFLRKKRVTKIHKVEDGDIVTLFEKLGDEKTTAIAGAAGHQDVLKHVNLSSLTYCTTPRHLLL